jgi:hypothetical protein
LSWARSIQSTHSLLSHSFNFISPLTLVLSQTNPLHSLLQHLFKAHLDILPSSPVFP